MEFEGLFKVIDRLSKYVVMSFDDQGDDVNEESGSDERLDAREKSYSSRYAEVEVC